MQRVCAYIRPTSLSTIECRSLKSDPGSSQSGTPAAVSATLGVVGGGGGHAPPRFPRAHSETKSRCARGIGFPKAKRLYLGGRLLVSTDLIKILKKDKDWLRTSATKEDIRKI